MLISGTKTEPRAAARRGRLRRADAFTLFAVATVVLLVSLPRLRDFALRENQGDASTLVHRLGRLLENSVEAGELASVQQLVEHDPEFAHQLGDAEFLEEGRLLRRHGYLFELVPAAGEEPAFRVRAWPWEHGRSGLASFVWLPGRGVARHANAEGHWSGREQPPAPVFTTEPSPDAAQWRLIED